MADHGTVEYATAPGNDYPAHEGTYEGFLHFAFTGLLHVVNLCFGLATGGVMGHWGWATIIFVLAALGGVFGMLNGTRTPSYVAFVLCFLIFAFNGLSGAGAH
ncbi:MAG: aa3-type cytochrome c oxidase subunit IV [Pseudolabrys sp.]|nr:aa3-type cytochrome c oxidase subunit IV [Pseudolabrys sp.]